MPLPEMNVIRCGKHGRAGLCHINVDGSHSAVDWCICDAKHGRVNCGCCIDAHNPTLKAEKLAKIGRTAEAEHVYFAAEKKPAERCTPLQLPLMAAGMPIA